MSSRFNEIGQRKIEYALIVAEQRAYYSTFYGCDVVAYECEKCGRWYEEEKEQARAKIVSADQMVCISCDSDAEEISVSAIRMSVLVVVV